MASLLADFARTDLGARRAAVLYEVGRTYSSRLAHAFIDRFGAGDRVVAEFHYLALETDFRPQLRRVVAFRPDVVFVPGSFTDATLVASQAGALGLRVALLGGDGWSSPRLFERAAPLGRAFFVDHCSPPPDFDRLYREAFGDEAHGCRAVLAADAVRTLVSALGTLGRLEDGDLGAGVARTRRRLRDAVARVAIDGATGPIRFDSHGDRRRGVALYEMERVEPGPPRPRLLGWLGEK
jgi:branched-chain amino acid transport system substrate-binding protein